MMTSLLRRSISCPRRESKSCHATQPSATEVAAETAPCSHQLALRAERPRSEPDYDQDKDTGAVSTPDANLNVRDESSDQIRQQEEQDEAEDGPTTDQTHRTIEYQKKKIDELKDMMLTLSTDVKATFAEIARNQKEHEQDFKTVRAELKELKGGMSRIKTNARQIEGAMEEWTEREGLETGEHEDVSAPDGAAPKEMVVLSQPCSFQEE